MPFRKAAIQHHGQILSRPFTKTEGTEHDVAYELGKCFQLDGDHCLLVASLDEQGGGDKCVGNDAYVFSSLPEIAPAHARPLNRPDVEFRLKSGNTAWLAKYPATGAFLPLEPRRPGSGTGLLVSTGMTFNADGSSIEQNSEHTTEFIQLAWDGRDLSVRNRAYVTELDGLVLRGTALSAFLVDEDAFLAPFATAGGMAVFRFEFQRQQWTCITHGQPFGSSTEMEPSIQKANGYYWVHTRGADPVGRLYRSRDGLDYELFREQALHTVPQSLNVGLDGDLYLATNPFPVSPAVWLRNPLVILPLSKDGYGAPIIVHDEGGIRGDNGDSIPFVDHAVGCNVFLEGRWRHLLWYRVCDLKERTAYSFQPELAKLIGTPKPRLSTSGLYLAEIVFNPGEQR